MQQITRGDYLKDLITIYIENHLQADITDLYSQFVFQCGTIQKFLTPAQVIKISLDEQESLQLTNYNICYLAGITQDGHKETFDGSIAFNTRCEVVLYEPTPNTSVQSATTSDNSSACPCQGISGVFNNCSQPAIKAYFSVNYVPTKLSELTNDTDFQDGTDVAASIAEHNTNESAHPYIQSSIVSATEALEIKIGEEETARKEAVSLAISTTEGYTDSSVSAAIETTEAYADGIVSAAITTTEAYADNAVSVHNTATNAHPYIQSVLTAATNNLQEQIDGLAAASDVTDIVSTYAELQAYDTQHLNNNDIIKVLSDETHDNQPSYYRYNKSTDTFSYIGSESAAYTKAQSNSIFVAKTTTVNNKALSSDITLTYSDVNALSETYATVISGNTSAIASNTTAIATNTSAISTINGKIPTDASTTNKLVTASALAASIANFANKDINNLSDKGEERLHALKCYEDAGELLTDPNGLAFIKKYAHSTFDASKFTKSSGWSGTITSDGIASGFSDSNYLRVLNLSLTQNNNIEIHFKGTFKTHPSNNAQMVFSFYSTRWEIGNALCAFKWENTSIIGGSYTNTLNDGDEIEAILSLSNANGHSMKIYANGTLIGNFTSSTAMGSATVSEMRLGYYMQSTGYYWLGTMDLKQFSITVDGVEVINGNKQGMDTIKPDDYTSDALMYRWSYDGNYIYADGSNFTYGFTTPFHLYNIDGSYYTGADWALTSSAVLYNGNAASYDSVTALITDSLTDVCCKITEDGVAYNFNRSANIYSTFNYSGGTLEASIGWYFKSNADVANLLYLSTNSASTVIFRIYLGASKNINLYGATGETKTILSTQYNPSEGDLIICKGKLNTNKTLTITVTNVTKNITASVTTTGTATNEPVSTGNKIFIGTGNHSEWYSGKIDLNCVKIYNNDNLIYQPCLKIPYTESKTGSKVVNSIYRPRVNDMAEQFGYAPYYTLDETNGNFTLPQVELYGLIQRQNFAPSNKYDNLTLGASGNTYVAPADGWFTISKTAGAADVTISLINDTTGLSINHYSSGNNDLMRAFLPVKKNDIIRVGYSATGTTNTFRFIYAQGSESEA